jgi:hypothetical protein
VRHQSDQLAPHTHALIARDDCHGHAAPVEPDSTCQRYVVARTWVNSAAVAPAQHVSLTVAEQLSSADTPHPHRNLWSTG